MGIKYRFSIIATSLLAAACSGDPLNKGFIRNNLSQSINKVRMATVAAECTTPDPDHKGQSILSKGAGFLVSHQGYIATVNHLALENCEKLTVDIADGRSFLAQRVGGDAKSDIAVLKISPLAVADITPIQWGNSDNLTVGDSVIADGNPFGDFPDTITRGIISARRYMPDIAFPVEFLQTDTAINHGNSGGPLFGQDAKVYGIVDALSNPPEDSDSNAGINFAIASNATKKAVNDIIAYGHVWPGLLPFDGEDAVDTTTYVHPIHNGFRIKALHPALISSGNRGFKINDVVVAFDRRNVYDALSLSTQA
jgi:serine protease Do